MKAQSNAKAEPSAEPEQKAIDNAARAAEPGRIMDRPASPFEQLRDLRPTPKEEISAEEVKIRAAEAEEEKHLQAALDAATAARIDAERDLAALERMAKKAGAHAYVGIMGMETGKNTDPRMQERIRFFYPIAEARVSETKEAERKSQVLLSSARTAHGRRRDRLYELRQREMDKARAAAKEQELRDQKTARLVALKEFLKS